MVCSGYAFSPSVLDVLLSDPAFMCGPKATSRSSSKTFLRNIPVDILEKNDAFEVLADVPGVQKGAINLAVDHNTLTISVSRPDDTPATPAPDADDSQASPDETAPTTEAVGGRGGPAAAAPDQPTGKAPGPKVLRRERAQRFAERSLKFSEIADLQAAQAECTDGVLRVSIPKKALPQPSRIRIA